MEISEEEKTIYLWAMKIIGDMGRDAGYGESYDQIDSAFWHSVLKDVEGASYDRYKELHFLWQAQKDKFKLN